MLRYYWIPGDSGIIKQYTKRRSLLIQKNYKANIWILMLKGTKDEVWVNDALKHFDKDKIKVYGS